jgi:hypothetical protein
MMDMLFRLLPLIYLCTTAFMGWDDVIYYIIAIAIAYATAPKATTPKPATLEEFELPTPEVGTAQCVVFGDCWTKDWEVLSYGNLRTQKVKSKSGK